MKYLILLLAFVGCTSRPCRTIQADPNSNTTMVYKYDGTLQCGMGTEITLDQAQKELKAIKVLSKVKKRDGLMRIQVCGSASGQANVFEIPTDKVKEAEKLGFKIWNF